MIIAAGMAEVVFNALWDPWPLPAVLLSHLGNSVSAVLGAWLVRRFIAERPTLSSVRELVGVIGLAGVLGLLPGAFNGALVVQSVDHLSFWDQFTAWYTSDLLGVILLTPAILVWQRGLERPNQWSTSARKLEFVALVGGICIVTCSAFYFKWLRQTETLYVAFPFTVWAALRFGLRGTTLVILVTALLAQFFTALGYGALGASSLTASQKSIEIMVSLGVFAIVGLLPATVFSALKTAHAREAIRTQTMTLMATGAKLPTILESIVLGVEAEQPGTLCSILLVDEAGTNLSVGSAPSLPQSFTKAINGIAIGSDAIACGTAASLNRRVIVSDIRDIPQSANGRHDIATQAGLRSCWSQPFHDSAGRLLGTFGAYHRHPRSPTEIDISLVTAASQVAAIATERKQLEEQFLRAQRMEGIGTLAGGIAHDLNNILTPIVIGTELLKEAGLNSENQRMLNNIELSARRGANLVKQVLTFARGEKGMREALNIGAIVHGMGTIATNTFPKNIIVRHDVANDLPTVNGDRTQLEQVLLNLCVNARDAMPQGGGLSITGRATNVDKKQASRYPGVMPGKFVEIGVADSGTGIAPEIIHRIFEPFYTTKSVGQGTGLGLSTVLGIVRGHGGFVEVTSELNRGSAFRVYLPAAQTSDASAAVNDGKAAAVPRGKGELILVVDDEAPVLETTKKALITFGYRVVTASNGAEALDVVALHGSTITAVVTDMMMPVMDGRQLISALRYTRPTLPIVTVSGLDSAADLLPSEVRYHLAKPYTAERLASILAQVLQKSGRRSQ